MNFMHVFVASTAAFLILGSGSAKSGQTINDVGAIVCINDKWDEKEVDKGHKLVDYAGRCVNVPTIPPHRNTQRTAWESTSTCPTRAGRTAGPAPTTSRAGTR
jgi:hypothetical protein